MFTASQKYSRSHHLVLLQGFTLGHVQTGEPGYLEDEGQMEGLLEQIFQQGYRLPAR